MNSAIPLLSAARSLDLGMGAQLDPEDVRLTANELRTLLDDRQRVNQVLHVLECDRAIRRAHPYIDWLDAHDPADASAAIRPGTKGNPLP